MFHVRAVTNSGKAIEILRSADSPILGVVTDIRFGELPDGWEVARIAHEIGPDIPIAYISGHGAVDWLSRGVPDSIRIEKPFTLAQLGTAAAQRQTAPSSERCLTAEMTRARPVNHQLPSCVVRPSMARLVHRYQPPGYKLEFESDRENRSGSIVTAHSILIGVLGVQPAGNFASRRVDNLDLRQTSSVVEEAGLCGHDTGSGIA